MKKTLLVLGFAAMSSALWAGGFGGEGRHWERLQQELSLTPEQSQQVKTIFEQEQQKQQALRAETQAALKAVLSAEQQAKLETLKAEPRSRKGWGPKDERPEAQ